MQPSPMAGTFRGRSLPSVLYSIVRSPILRAKTLQRLHAIQGEEIRVEKEQRKQRAYACKIMGRDARCLSSRQARQPRHQRRPKPEQEHAEYKYPNKRPRGAVYILHGQAGNGALHSKQHITEWRRQTANGRHDQEHGPEPDGVKSEMSEQGFVDRNQHQHDGELIQKHEQHERHRHHHEEHEPRRQIEMGDKFADRRPARP